jgi:tRNA A-37 threonylcarbamoyl transferase component Bud32
MMGLMPVWAIIVPFCLGLFIALLVTQQGVAPIPAAIVLAALTLIPAASVALAALCEDDRITVSKEGLAFPLMMMQRLNFRRERLWSDLGAAKLLTRSNQQALQLQFRSGGTTTLNMSNLSKSDLEQLMLAIEVWGQNCERAPDLIEMQNRLQNANRGIEHISYTQMWEEELSRRFSATSFVPLEPNQVLLEGRFKIVRQLAFGGLSAIYLAQQNDTDLVVIKEAVVPASADEQSRKKAVELFERESRLLIRLNHANIAKVLDHFAEKGRNYLVLEYIRGQDLRQLVKQNGAQPEELVVHWAVQITSILDYLHNQNPPIIHRDLTPDNLVRKEGESIVLIDFGAANEFVGTATGTLVGKQAYIAPEQLRGKASTASDIYALGGTIYYLLVGKDPEALSESRPSEQKPEVSKELDELVVACTQLEPGDRPRSPKELHAKLQALADKLSLEKKAPDAAEVAT